ncbi:MAG: SDR family NAD(P)-dependent oxidoreductase [Candidatus Odinarchaeota archaeon]
MGLFDGKVVCITGAGGGIGRSHALAFAREGAKVVVNDLGTAPDGSGSTVSMADKVVAEIIALGGEAIASYDSVATIDGGENIIQTALDNYGKIDILINNAGILRDKTVIKMEEENWDIVLAVHLKGTFSCTRAAARVMKEQGTGGRIINTSSLAGLMGNFGQSNYGAAKAGIYGFTRVTALELERYGITVNCIVPMARTRLTAGIDAIPEEMTPEQVSPMVLFLASEKARGMTGHIIGIHGQHLFEYQMKMTPGVEKSGTDLWTVDEIAGKFGEITEMAVTGEKEKTSAGPSIDELFQLMPLAFNPEKAEGWKSILHFELTGADDWCINVDTGKVTVSKDIPAETKCVIRMSAETMKGMISGKVDPTKAFMAGNIKASNMHELVKFNNAFSFEKLRQLLEEGSGILSGAAERVQEVSETVLDPSMVGMVYTAEAETIEPEKIIAYARATNETNPRYFEDDETKLMVPPIFPVTTLIGPMKEQILVDDTLNLDVINMIHGEHEILYHRVLRPRELIQTTVKLESIENKKTGDILWAKINGLAENIPVYEMRAGFFFKKPRKGPRPITAKREEKPVKREVIVSKQMVVTPDQSVRYAKASGDDNPIHQDRDIARAVGLPDIILHGLCTLAFATQVIVDELAAGDPGRVKRVKTRFSKPVFMNDTLTTEGWIIEEKEKSKVIGFETKNQDGMAVLTRGEAEILK